MDYERVAALAAPVLALFSGFVIYVRYHDYGLLNAEIVICFTILGGFGVSIGALLRKWRGTPAYALAYFLISVFVLDLQYQVIPQAAAFITADDFSLWRIGLAVICLWGVFVLVFGLRQHIASVTAAVFGVSLLGGLLLPADVDPFGVAEESAKVASDPQGLPPRIHLVLDGHIGVTGIPQDIPGGAALEADLRAFYKRWGFRLYGGAHSQYFRTYNSLGNLLNIESSPRDGAQVASRGREIFLKENAYFRQMAEMGYRLRVYQSDYLDFCTGFEALIEQCYRYPAFSIRAIKAYEFSVTERSKLILGAYLTTSNIYRGARLAYRAGVAWLGDRGVTGLPAWEGRNFDLYGLAAPMALDILERDLKENPLGRVFFAHLLLPHSPYFLNAACAVELDSSQWASRRLDHHNRTTIGTPAYRRAAYVRYFGQVRCAMQRLVRIFTILEEQDLLDKATIIVHSDHGSRITVIDPVAARRDRFSARDSVDGFSSLFAIRAPSIEPGYDNALIALQNLFAKHVLGVPSPAMNGQVYLEAPAGQRDMPAMTLPDFTNPEYPRTTNQSARRKE